MDASLVRERRIADVRLMLVRHQIRNFCYKARYLLQMGQPFAQGRPLHFQLKIGDYRTEIRVPTALSDSVDGALHLHDAHFDRHERIRHRHFAIVVRMDAEWYRTFLLYDLADFLDLPGHGAP